jgi:hypothetical protein
MEIRAEMLVNRLAKGSKQTVGLKVAALAAALFTATNVAATAEESGYPDWRGQWTGVLRSRPGISGQASFDPGKPAVAGRRRR